jgi:hypothetical protein
MIVAVLVFIWVIALTPFILRRLSEHQIATSVSRFRTAIRMLRRVYPRLVTSAEIPGAVVTTGGSSPEFAAVRRRREAERARRQIARRKQLLVRLVGGTATTVVFGALPHLHALWDLSIAGALLTAGYLGGLALLASQSARSTSIDAARRLAPKAMLHPVEHRLAAGGGGGPHFVAQIPRRPSFVVVDPNS